MARLSGFRCSKPTLRFSIDIRDGRLLMRSDKDIAPLTELLKMAADLWPGSGEISLTEMFQRDQILLEMWPEACRRTGVGKRQFPPGVIKLWKEGAGRAN